MIQYCALVLYNVASIWPDQLYPFNISWTCLHLLSFLEQITMKLDFLSRENTEESIFWIPQFSGIITAGFGKMSFMENNQTIL